MSRRTKDELDEIEHVRFYNAQRAMIDEYERKLRSAACRRASTVSEDEGGDNPWLSLRIRAMEEGV